MSHSIRVLLWSLFKKEEILDAAHWHVGDMPSASEVHELLIIELAERIEILKREIEELKARK
jgi:uncharacterized small protein (DUF1192 family)